MAEKEHSKTTTPTVLIHMFYRHWRLFLLGTMLFAIAVFVFAHYVPLKYTGTAIFERRKDPAANPVTDRGSESFKSRKLTLAHEIMGREAVEQAVEQLNLTRGFIRDESGQLTQESERRKQELIDQLSTAIKVKWEVSSDEVDIVSVSFTSSDPELAEKMPNTLVSNYINLVGEQGVSRLNASQEFLDLQVKNCSSRLSDLIKQRIDFELKHAGILPDSPGAIQENITRLNTDIDTLRLQYTMAKEELVRLEELKRVNTPTSNGAEGEEAAPTQIIKGKNPKLEPLENALEKTQEALRETLAIRTDKHPMVELLQEKITSLESKIAELEPEVVIQKIYGVGTGYNDLSMQILATQTRMETTGRELERAEKRLEANQALLANFGPIRREYLDLVKKIEDQQEELRRWENSLTAAKMELAAEAAKRRTHLGAIQAALKQFQPSSPALIHVMLAALAGGAAFGLGLIFLSNWYEQALVTPDTAGQLYSVPVLGYSDVIETPQQKAYHRMKTMIITPVVFALLLGALGISMYSLTLRLRHPDDYRVWKATPVHFLIQQMKTAENTPGA